MIRLHLFILSLLALSSYAQDTCIYLPLTFDANCEPIYCIMNDTDTCEVFMEEFVLVDNYGEIYSMKTDSLIPYYSALFIIGHEITSKPMIVGNYGYRMKIYFKKEDCWGEFRGEVRVYNSL